MAHFLVKLGKKKWVKYMVPSSAFLTAGSYMFAHSYGHGRIRDLLAAADHEGRRKDLSERLKATIVSVYEEIKDKYAVPILTAEKIGFSPRSFEPPELKWFCASTLDPIALGYSESEKGVMIGLPDYYNFETIDDITPQSLKFTKVNLFKRASKIIEDSTGPSGVRVDPIVDSNEFSEVVISKDSEVGKEYMDAILLSEDAKRFSIARELFYTDSYRILFQTGNILMSHIVARYLAQIIIAKRHLDKGHVSQRLAIYFMALIIGVLHFRMVTSLVEAHHGELADRRAAELSQTYREGGIEYLQKLMQRNRALEQAVPDFSGKFTEDGDIKISRFKVPFSLSTRLDNLKNMQEAVITEKSENQPS